MNYLAHIITDDMITIVTDETVLSVPSHHPRHEVIRGLLSSDPAEAIREATTLNRAVSGYGVTVIDGAVWYNGEVVHNAVASRILRMIEEGIDDPAPMVAFLSNLMENPSARARTELYRFLESNNLPITSDGHFLAYKNVREDYRDKHSGTFDNSVGAVCKMDRRDVMDDPTVTCSTGLHFCSMEYLNSMWGHSGRTMVVKVNPADVVSIPVDYNNSKGRTCRYEVVAEHRDGSVDTLSDRVVA